MTVGERHNCMQMMMSRTIPSVDCCHCHFSPLSSHACITSHKWQILANSDSHTSLRQVILHDTPTACTRVWEQVITHCQLSKPFQIDSFVFLGTVMYYRNICLKTQFCPCMGSYFEKAYTWQLICEFSTLLLFRLTVRYILHWTDNNMNFQSRCDWLSDY